MTDETLRLTVRAAEKRDAGRGIARLPESARKTLGVLSGDTVLIEGERETVAKLWPARGDVPDGTVCIDADTRTNAGVKIGDTVAVSAASVPPAKRVTLRAPAVLSRVDIDAETVERLATADVRNRPVQAGDRVRIERLSGIAFVVEETRPDGRVLVSEETAVSVVFEEGEGQSTADSGRTTEQGRTTIPVEGDSGRPDARSPAGEGGGERARSGRIATGVTYEDIGGLDEELELVREMIELPLSRPDLFARLGVDPPKGVLLHGPPGTGKTLIAKAVANEVDASFTSISGPEIMSKYKGESEERLRTVFEDASENAPAIVFFDEIDSIAPKREDGGDVESRLVGQLLSLMDGLDARGDVVVIGATNRVDEIDPALRRGGRFDREIEIGVPGEEGRREILDVHTRRMPLAEDVDLDRLAGRTHGFTGADLESLAKEAAMTSLRRVRHGAGDPRENGEDAGARVEVESRDASEEDAATGTAETTPETVPAGDIDPAQLEVTRADFEQALSAVGPSAMREYVAETPRTTFEDVGGLDDAKRTLQRAVTWPLTYGPLFDAANATPPTGVLLHGPPGTGKTLLARAIAGESGVNFVQVAGPELLDRYVGESEKAVREVFTRARQSAPSIVFFDEIDAVATDRDRSSDSDVGERVVSQLLTELDRVADNPTVLVLAATNRMEALDPALLRPGRLESHVLVPAPDAAARRAIVAVHTADKPLADDVDLDAFAAELEGYSGADLTAVIREAALLAIEDVTDRYEGGEANAHADEVRITADHLERARARVDGSL